VRASCQTKNNRYAPLQALHSLGRTKSRTRKNKNQCHPIQQLYIQAINAYTHLSKIRMNKRVLQMQVFILQEATSSQATTGQWLAQQRV
jgi:hypothetical protein